VESYKNLIENNRAWATKMLAQDPEFFARTDAGQEPHFLMIGCSDSRVPLEMMTGAKPGDIFVTRNIGNQVWSTDVNMLSVLHYAINVLDVPHVIVCGHDNCGALKAAIGPASNGLVDHWLSDIRNTLRWHKDELDACADPKARLAMLAELNVMQQLGILSRTPVVQDAWERGKRPVLHGWVYDIGTGLVRVVKDGIDSAEKAAAVLPNN
jgi:carbonic anhydrase